MRQLWRSPAEADASYIGLKQLSPAALFQVPMSEVVDVHRAVPPSELLVWSVLGDLLTGSSSLPLA